jgi:hypothetical protein
MPLTDATEYTCEASQAAEQIGQDVADTLRDNILTYIDERDGAGPEGVVRVIRVQESREDCVPMIDVALRLEKVNCEGDGIEEFACRLERLAAAVRLERLIAIVERR